MSSEALGRTNTVFPPIWLRPILPKNTGELGEMISALQESKAPIDIGSQPGLWGGLLRGVDHVFTYVGSNAAARAVSERHAIDVVQADLIQTLSALGRETLDIYFLRIHSALEEYQINGALEAIEGARQEGHVRFVGLCCDGSAYAALSAWQFHDAFELLQVPRNLIDDEAYKTLLPLAKERRVGVVTSRPLEWAGDISVSQIPGEWIPAQESSNVETSLDELIVSRLVMDHPVIVSVSSSKEVKTMCDVKPLEDSSLADAYLSDVANAFTHDAPWTDWENGDDAALRRAARSHLERV